MKKNALYILSFIIAIFFIACNEGEDHNDQIESEPTIVRIKAAINLNEDNTSSTKRATRATGKVDESNTDYSEGKENGNDNENKVNTARLFAFDPVSGNTIKNILYRFPGETLGAGEKHFAYEYNASKLSLNLDMEIMTGSYIFVLVTNEESAWNLGSSNTYSTTMSLASNILNPIITVDNLNNNVSQKSGIPMVGEAAIKVTADPNATADNPLIINDPIIELERTLTKVEVSIQNTDDEINVIETAKPYQIKSATLINANQKYNLFKGNNNPVAEQYISYTSLITHATGALFKKQNIFTGYMAERKNVKEADATKVRIVVSANETDYEYDIPLFQYEDASESNKNYDIHRNTIYRLGTVLKGKEITYTLEVFTAVEGWQKVTIGELDIPPVEFLHLDRRTINLNTDDLTVDYIDKIYYTTDLAYKEYKTEITGLKVVDNYEYFEITIPKGSLKAGEAKPITLSFNKGAQRLLNVIIMVKAI